MKGTKFCHFSRIVKEGPIGRAVWRPERSLVKASVCGKNRQQMRGGPLRTIGRMLINWCRRLTALVWAGINAETQSNMCPRNVGRIGRESDSSQGPRRRAGAESGWAGDMAPWFFFVRPKSPAKRRNPQPPASSPRKPTRGGKTAWARGTTESPWSENFCCRPHGKPPAANRERAKTSDRDASHARRVLRGPRGKPRRALYGTRRRHAGWNVYSGLTSTILERGQRARCWGARGEAACQRVTTCGTVRFQRTRSDSKRAAKSLDEKIERWKTTQTKPTPPPLIASSERSKKELGLQPAIPRPRRNCRESACCGNASKVPPRATKIKAPASSAGGEVRWSSAEVRKSRQSEEVWR